MEKKSYLAERNKIVGMAEAFSTNSQMFRTYYGIPCSCRNVHQDVKVEIILNSFICLSVTSKWACDF